MVTRRIWQAVCVAAFATGCIGMPAPGALLCAPDQGCPTSMACGADNRCYPAGAVPDAGPSDAGPPDAGQTACDAGLQVPPCAGNPCGAGNLCGCLGETLCSTATLATNADAGFCCVLPGNGCRLGGECCGHDVGYDCICGNCTCPETGCCGLRNQPCCPGKMCAGAATCNSTSSECE